MTHKRMHRPYLSLIAAFFLDSQAPVCYGAPISTNYSVELLKPPGWPLYGYRVGRVFAISSTSFCAISMPESEMKSGHDWLIHKRDRRRLTELLICSHRKGVWQYTKLSDSEIDIQCVIPGNAGQVFLAGVRRDRKPGLPNWTTVVQCRAIPGSEILWSAETQISADDVGFAKMTTNSAGGVTVAWVCSKEGIREYLEISTLVSLDHQGQPLWRHDIQSDGTVTVAGICSLTSGQIAVAGAYYGTRIDQTYFPLDKSPPGCSGFIEILSSDTGSPLKLDLLTSTKVLTIGNIHLNAEGQLLIGGRFKGTMLHSGIGKHPPQSESMVPYVLALAPDRGTVLNVSPIITEPKNVDEGQPCMIQTPSGFSTLTLVIGERDESQLGRTQARNRLRRMVLKEYDRQGRHLGEFELGRARFGSFRHPFSLVRLDAGYVVSFNTEGYCYMAGSEQVPSFAGRVVPYMRIIKRAPIAKPLILDVPSR